VAVCRIEDGAYMEGPRPTVEVNLHAGILRARGEMDVVMHFQSAYATVLTCQDVREVNFFVIPEIPFYIGAIGHVGYVTPGSQALAEATVEVMREHNLALMANHGQVTAAKGLDQAIENAEFFELACRVIVQSGDKVRSLSEEAVRELRALGSQAGHGAV
jgi:ribulose-5-phosphate 4-epimerase/fuculose-1-phosphate aldolase